MEKLRITFGLLFVTITLCCHAQKFSFGAGAAAHFGYFSMDNSQALIGSGYENPSTLGAGLSFIMDYQGTETFSFRFSPTFSNRQIRLTEVQEGINRGNSNYLAINFVTMDIGLSGRFLLPLKDWRLTPFAGLNFSFNKHTDSAFTAQNSSAGSAQIIAQLSQGNSFGPDDLFIKPGILAGLAFGRMNGKLELESKIVYTPVNYVNGDTTIPISTDTNIPLRGKFQYISVGLNFKFG